MTKQEIYDKIEKYQLEIISNLEKDIEGKHIESDLDESDVRPEDDRSQQDESQAISIRLMQQLDTAKLNLKRLQNISITEKDIVSEGSIIETKNLILFVSIPTQLIKTEGEKDVIGVSTEAPVFKTLLGQKQGFPFSFGGIACEIADIR